MADLFSIHVRTITGLDRLLSEELTSLGATDVRPGNRVVTCMGDLELLYQANLWCRTAIRVLLPLTSFAARDEKAFYQAIREIDWSQWLPETGTLAVGAHVHSSFCTHSLFLAQLVKDAVVDQFRDKTGNRPSVDLKSPDLRIEVSLFQDHAHVYVDASGDSLHKRGYRQRAGLAPLNETLAAGIIKLSGWDGTTPFFDPMCGSGTFAIEAGLMLRNVAPGLIRKRFGFQHWPNYDSVLFDTLVAEARSVVRQDVDSSLIIGIDEDPLIIELARENAERAGLTDLIRFETGDFFSWDKLRGKSGHLVMNPPYDERLAVHNVNHFFEKIGDRLKQNYGGCRASILCGNPQAAKHIGLRSSQRIALFNGAIECRLFIYELQSDSRQLRHLSANAVPADNAFKWKEKSETFANRLRKNWKHYSKLARRQNITCWRIYDKDIPELPFILDLYADHLHFAEVPRNYDHPPSAHAAYLQLMLETARTIVEVDPKNVHLKVRQPPKPGTLRNPNAEKNLVEVTEKGHRFLVNLEDYVDTGLFLEQRNLRALIENEVSGKDFLNLFAYTGSLSVYAASGKAKSTTTVDSSGTYLDWAKGNMRLNGFSGNLHRYFKSDVSDFLTQTSATFDWCVCRSPGTLRQPHFRSNF